MYSSQDLGTANPKGYPDDESAKEHMEVVKANSFLVTNKSAVPLFARLLQFIFRFVQLPVQITFRLEIKQSH